MQLKPRKYLLDTQTAIPHKQNGHWVSEIYGKTRFGILLGESSAYGQFGSHGVNEIIKGVSETEKPSKNGLEPLVTLKFRRKLRQNQQTCQDEITKKVRENSKQMKKVFPGIKNINSWVPLQMKRTSIFIGSHRKFAFLKAFQTFLKHQET